MLLRIKATVALIMAGYRLWLTTTSLSYARVHTVENELWLSLGVFLLATGQFGSHCHALGSIKAGEVWFEKHVNPK